MLIGINKKGVNDFLYCLSDNILVDYSKNRITEQTMDLLTGLAREAGLETAIEKMFSGDLINETENRAVLHTALRNMDDTPVFVDGHDIMPGIRKVLEKDKEYQNEIKKRKKN
jgi:glucose-6-phosphate isomerase